MTKGKSLFKAREKITRYDSSLLVWRDEEYEDDYHGYFESYLIPGPPTGKIRRMTFLDPFDYPYLFRTFAELEPDKESFLQFANTYGELDTAYSDWQDTAIHTAEKPKYSNTFSLTRWRQDHHLLRRAILLSDGIKSDAWVDAMEDITFDPASPYDEDHYLVTDNKFDAIKPKQSNPGVYFVYFSSIKRIEESSFVTLTITDKDVDEEGEITKTVALRLLAEWISNGLRDASPSLKQSGASFELEMTSDTLIGAMWCQLADAVAKNTEFRQCANCGGWFSVSGRHARSDKQYCSGGCRLKAFKARQQQAATTSSDGTPEQPAPRRPRKNGSKPPTTDPPT
jgi:hypothetical protein